jgi:hypothetical protein
MALEVATRRNVRSWTDSGCEIEVVARDVVLHERINRRRRVDARAVEVELPFVRRRTFSAAEGGLEVDGVADDLVVDAIADASIAGAGLVGPFENRHGRLLSQQRVCGRSKRCVFVDVAGECGWQIVELAHAPATVARIELRGGDVTLA